MSGIRILITGGTFDKVYDERAGQLEFRESNLPAMLKQSRCNRPAIALQTVFLKDSLHLTDEDRQQIGRACQLATEERIIITHGTDTMTETARGMASLSVKY